MSMRIDWSDAALTDMRRISEYVSQHNRPAAKKLIQGFRRSAKHLSEHPFLGRMTQIESVRELVVHPNYLISYRVGTEFIVILQVWHVAQQRYH
jgi:toxin ParE1/3/4